MNGLYAVLLAGGQGERLWPLSTPERPKQLIPFINGRTLLDDTLARAAACVTSPHARMIVVHEKLAKSVRVAVGDQAHIVVEPTGKNTAPAILLACLEIAVLDPSAIIVIMPTDHFIPDYAAFCRELDTAAATAEQLDTIVLLGVTPTHPATGYGYIQYEHGYPLGDAYPVVQFHEKPNQERAHEYCSRGDMLWNIGVFVGKVGVFIDEFKALRPELFDAMEAYRAGTGSYDAVEHISFDYAILEKSDRVMVIPVAFAWHDVGNLATFLALREHYQYGSDERMITVNAQDNLVMSSKKIVALVGVHDLCVVETPDVLLIVARDQAEQVRQVVSELRERSLPRITMHELLP